MVVAVKIGMDRKKMLMTRVRKDEEQTDKVTQEEAPENKEC